MKSFWKKIKQVKIPEPEVVMFSSPETDRDYLEKCWGTRALQAYWDFENMYKQINELEVNKDMAENYIVINGKRAELTKEQLEQLGIKMESEQGPYEALSQETYYTIGIFGEAIQVHSQEIPDCYDFAKRDTYTCFNDFKFAQQVAWHQELERKLWNFSFLNGYRSQSHKGYYITRYLDGSYNIYGSNEKAPKNYAPYFSTQEAAMRAIDEVIKPFMAEHPEFYWGM